VTGKPASDRGLFERLRLPDLPGERTALHRHADRIHESVLHHLKRLLRTREGECPSVPEFGVPALTDVNYAGRGDELRRAIETAIRSFEPRLESVRVKYLDPEENDPLKIRFEITGRIVTDQEDLSVRFSTVADSAAGWKVSS